MFGTSHTRIAVLEQMPLFRAGLVQVLNVESGMEVVAEGHAIAHAPNAYAAVDVIVVDATLLSADDAPTNLSAICAQAQVILLAFTADEEEVRIAFAAGVRGYVLKGGGRNELLDAVRAAKSGQDYVSPALAALILRRRGSEAQDGREAVVPAQLSHRETQIFDLLAAGLKNKEIGGRLNLSEKSIKRYVTCIFEKLNVRNRVEAAMLSRARSKPVVSSGKPKASGLDGSEIRPTKPNIQIAGVNEGAGFSVFGASGQMAFPDNAADADGVSTTANTHCFNAVFGRAGTSVDDAFNRAAAAGTHIVLRQD